MSKILEKEIDINKLVKGKFEVRISITGITKFKWRLRLARLLIRIASKLIGQKVEFVVSIEVI